MEYSLKVLNDELTQQTINLERAEEYSHSTLTPHINKGYIGSCKRRIADLKKGISAINTQMNIENPSKQTDEVQVIISPEFCSACSPNTFGNYKVQCMPNKQICSKCGTVHYIAIAQEPSNE